MTKKLLNKKIVILDACTVSNGDVDFGTFESLGDVKIYDVLNGDELTEACREAEVLLVNKTRVDEKLISACPRLELICLFATGYDNVDIEAAKKRRYNRVQRAALFRPERDAARFRHAA